MEKTQLFSSLFRIAFGLGIFGLFIGYVFYQAGQRKKAYAELASSLPEQPGTNHFLMKYASESFFKKLFKIFPWEGAGTLLINPSEIIFNGQLEIKQKIEIRFDPQKTKVDWVGRTFINGATSWLAIEQEGQKFYFTAETGKTVFGSKDKTREIYQQLQAYLEKPAVG